MLNDFSFFKRKKTQEEANRGLIRNIHKNDQIRTELRERYRRAGILQSEEALNRQYTYFDTVEEREMVYRVVARTTEYLHENHVHNIVFIDRSARAAWIGVHEYWKLKFSEEEQPNFYFINPLPLRDEFLEKAEKNITPRETEVEDTEMFEIMERILSMDESEREKDLNNEIEQTYTALMKERDEPLVIFDTCAHSGTTLRLVGKAFSSLGFSDVRYITATEPDDFSLVDPVLYCCNMSEHSTCRPFGKELAVKKGDSMVSETHDTEKLRLAAQMPTTLFRTEIRSIIRDYIAQEQTLTS